METNEYERLASIIRELYRIVGKLETDYCAHRRHFTLDGHLVGSIGEVYAAERYGIKLFASSAPTHDGIASDGKLVQIKATQRNSVALNDNPDYLIVLRIDERGGIDEVYNGPGKPVWDLFANRKRPKNGQYQVSVARLKRLNETIPCEERIPSRKQKADE